MLETLLQCILRKTTATPRIMIKTFRRFCSILIRIRGGNRARMAVTGHRLSVTRTRARGVDGFPDGLDGRVHWHRKFHHGRACGTADGPNGAQVHCERVHAAHVHRMDAVTVWPSSESTVTSYCIFTSYRFLVEASSKRHPPPTNN